MIMMLPYFDANKYTNENSNGKMDIQDVFNEYKKAIEMMVFMIKLVTECAEKGDSSAKGVPKQIRAYYETIGSDY